MASEVCDVHTEVPPTKENPLPEYGEIYRKRQVKNMNRMGAANEAYMLRKRLKCRAKPLEDKCIPKEVLLPFKEIPESAGRYLQYAGHASKGKSMKSDVPFPRWLIELSDDQLQSVLDAKEMLATGKPLCELVDPFYQAVSALGGDLSEDDVVQILRRIPSSSSGYSFSHFMFIAGNPGYAKKKDVLQEPIPFTLEQCEEAQKQKEKQQQDGDDTKGSMSKEKRKNVVDRLYQLPKVAGMDNWPPKKSSKGSGDNSDDREFTQNEKLFYSALLYCEMYDTMEAIRKIYAGGISIPESKAKTLQRAQDTGFGVSDIGIRKLGFAEWDRPLPPLPKTSPYIADFPLVGRRMKYVNRPNPQNPRRSKVTFDPMFMSIKAPEAFGEATKVIADSRRIKGILALLASEGNCLAMLPNVHFILHLSDTLMNKLVEVNGPINPIKKEVRNEELKIMKEDAKNLFRPHGLPKEVAQIPEMISFSDAIKLREICTQIREQHWAFICQRKVEFREKVWQLMHVDRIPCGNLRESFVYSFQVYIPEKSYLPIVHDTSASPC